MKALSKQIACEFQFLYRNSRGEQASFLKRAWGKVLLRFGFKKYPERLPLFKIKVYRYGFLTHDHIHPDWASDYCNHLPLEVLEQAHKFLRSELPLNMPLEYERFYQEVRVQARRRRIYEENKWGAAPVKQPLLEKVKQKLGG